MCTPPLQSNIRMLVFSGDVDAIVPVTGTMTWLTKLGLPILEEKRQWLVNEQVGGRVTVFDGLTFTTVRNAGHMVSAVAGGDSSVCVCTSPV